MFLSYLEIFHIYGFQDACLTNSCRHLHNEFSKEGKSFSYDRSNIVRIIVLSLSILPVIGQIVGILSIVVGIKSVKSKNYAERVNGISLLFRGILTLLGLGIICLLIDIIITISSYLKSQVYNF